MTDRCKRALRNDAMVFYLIHVRPVLVLFKIVKP